MKLYAWIGEDEFGMSGVGIKQGAVPAGMIPLVAVDRNKLDQDYIQRQLRDQVNLWGKTIRLAEFEFVRDVVVLKPS